MDTYSRSQGHMTTSPGQSSQGYSSPYQQRSTSTSSLHEERSLQKMKELSPSKFTSLSQAKAVLLGDVAAGKTSVLNALRFKRSRLAPSGASGRTIGIEVHSVSLASNVKLWFYDFGGHDTYHYSHQMFLSDKAIYIITVDISEYQPENFHQAVGYWYQVLTSRLVGPMMCVLATHTDLVDTDTLRDRCADISIKLQAKEREAIQTVQKELDFVNGLIYKDQLNDSDPIRDFRGKSLARPKDQLQKLLDHRPHVHHSVICISSKTMAGIPELCDSLLHMTRTEAPRFPTSQVPTAWVELGEAIAKVRHKTPFLTKTEFYSVAGEHGVAPEYVPYAFKYLMSCGIILHYEDNKKDSPLRDFVFNNPNLLLAIFGLIFNHNYYNDEIRFVWSNKSMLRLPKIDFENLRANLRKEAIAGEKLLRCFWSSTGIAEDVFDVILSLLEKFDLCYEVPSFGKKELPEGRNFRFPYLLKPRPPSETWGIWPTDCPANTAEFRLLLCLNTPQMPLGLMEKISVRVNPYLDHRVDWKTGIVAFCNSGQDLIRIESRCGETGVETCDIALITRTRRDRGPAVRNMVLVMVATINKILTRQYPGVLGYWYVQCGHCVRMMHEGKLQKQGRHLVQPLDSFPADNFVFATPLAMRWQFQCRNCTTDEWLSVSDVFPVSEELESATPGPEYCPENQAHWQVLAAHQEDLSDQIEAKFIINDLLKRGVLNVTSAAAVSARRTKHTRNKALVETLQQGSEKSFLTFLDVLRKEGGFPRLADVLETALTQKKLNQPQQQSAPTRPDALSFSVPNIDNIHDVPQTPGTPGVPRLDLKRSGSSDGGTSPDQFYSPQMSPREGVPNNKYAKFDNDEDDDNDERDIFDDSVELIEESDEEDEVVAGESKVSSFDALSKYLDEVKDLKSTLPLLNEAVAPSIPIEERRIMHSDQSRMAHREPPPVPPKPHIDKNAHRPMIELAKSTVVIPPPGDKENAPLLKPPSYAPPPPPSAAPLAKVNTNTQQQAAPPNQQPDIKAKPAQKEANNNQLPYVDDSATGTSSEEASPLPSGGPPPKPTTAKPVRTSLQTALHRKTITAPPPAKPQARPKPRIYAPKQTNDPTPLSPIFEASFESRSPRVQCGQPGFQQTTHKPSSLTYDTNSAQRRAQILKKEAVADAQSGAPVIVQPTVVDFSDVQRVDVVPIDAQERRMPEASPKLTWSVKFEKEGQVDTIPNEPPAQKSTAQEPVIEEAPVYEVPSSNEPVSSQHVDMETIVEEEGPIYEVPASNEEVGPIPRKDTGESSATVSSRDSGSSSSIPVHVVALICCKDSIMKQLDARDILAPLLNRSVIDEATAEKIKSHKTKLNRNKRLLQALKRGDERDLVMFSTVVRHKARLPELADMIEAELYSQKEHTMVVNSPGARVVEVEHESNDVADEHNIYEDVDVQEEAKQRADDMQQPPPENVGGRYAPHTCAILACKDTLLKELDAQTLTPALVDNKVLDNDLAQSILKHKSRNNRNKRLLQVLKGADRETFIMFADVLRHVADKGELTDSLMATLHHYDQQHPDHAGDAFHGDNSLDQSIVSLEDMQRQESVSSEADDADSNRLSTISTDSSSGLTDYPPHVLALLANKDSLINKMDARPLIDPLVKRGVLDNASVAEINSRKSKVNRNKKLLQLLKKSDSQAFHHFCDALEQDGERGKLAELLRSTCQHYQQTSEPTIDSAVAALDAAKPHHVAFAASLPSHHNGGEHNGTSQQQNGASPTATENSPAPQTNVEVSKEPRPEVKKIEPPKMVVPALKPMTMPQKPVSLPPKPVTLPKKPASIPPKPETVAPKPMTVEEPPKVEVQVEDAHKDVAHPEQEMRTTVDEEHVEEHSQEQEAYGDSDSSAGGNTYSDSSEYEEAKNEQGSKEDTADMHQHMAPPSGSDQQLVDTTTSPPTHVWVKTRAVKMQKAKDAFLNRGSEDESLSPELSPRSIPPPPSFLPPPPPQPGSQHSSPRSQPVSPRGSQGSQPTSPRSSEATGSPHGSAVSPVQARSAMLRSPRNSGEYRADVVQKRVSFQELQAEAVEVEGSPEKASASPAASPASDTVRRQETAELSTAEDVQISPGGSTNDEEEEVQEEVVEAAIKPTEVKKQPEVVAELLEVPTPKPRLEAPVPAPRVESPKPAEAPIPAPRVDSPKPLPKPRVASPKPPMEEKSDLKARAVSTGALNTKPVADPEDDMERAASTDALSMPPHVMAILTCKDTLTEAIDAKKLTGPLVNRKLMEPEAAAEVTSRKSKLNRNKKLLQFLKKSDESVFLGFINVLKWDCGEEELADTLLRAYSNKPAAAPPEPRATGGLVAMETVDISNTRADDEESFNAGIPLAESSFDTAGLPDHGATPESSHHTTILSCKDMLLQDMDSKDVVPALVRRGLLDQPAADSVLSRKSKLNRNKRLLQLLKAGDVNLFTGFCQVLREDGKNSQLADTLESTLYYNQIHGGRLRTVSLDISDTESTGSLHRTMSDASLASIDSLSSVSPHVAAILSCKQRLLDEIDAKKLVPVLEARGLLDATAVHAVTSRKSKLNRNKRLLAALKHGSEPAFCGFCEVLELDVKTADLADLLISTYKDQQVQQKAIGLVRAGSKASISSDISTTSGVARLPHVNAILACRDTILNNIDAKPIVHQMQSSGYLDEAAVAGVLERKSKINRNKKLLQTLKHSDERTFNGFCDVLRTQPGCQAIADALAKCWYEYQVEQEAVAGDSGLVRADSSASLSAASDVSEQQPPGTPVAALSNMAPHVAAILSCKDMLLNDIDAKKLVGPLESSGYLDEATCRGIASRKTKLNRNKKLLQSLKHGDERTFNGFCDVLRNEGLETAADALARAWCDYQGQKEEDSPAPNLSSSAPVVATPPTVKKKSPPPTETRDRSYSEVSAISESADVTTATTTPPPHVAAILACKELLLSDMDAKHIVGPLQERGALDADAVAAVTERKSKVNRNKKLLQTLKSADVSCFDAFCGVLLDDLRTVHIGEALTQAYKQYLSAGTSADTNTTASQGAEDEESVCSEVSSLSSVSSLDVRPPHVQTLLTCKDALLRDMDARHMVAPLVARGNITKAAGDGVTARKTKLNRNKKMLQLLKHSDESVFLAFCDTLRNEGKLPLLAETLDSTMYHFKLQQEGNAGDVGAPGDHTADAHTARPPHVLALLAHKEQIHNDIDAKPIVQSLVQLGVLDEATSSQVTIKKNKVNRNKRLLQLLKHEDESVFRSFCNAVRSEAGNSQLADSLEGSLEKYRSSTDDVFSDERANFDHSRDFSMDMSMDRLASVTSVGDLDSSHPAHVMTIVQHRDALMEEFDAKKVIKPLIAKGVIPESEAEDVLSRKSKHNRNKKMLQLLRRHDATVFCEFCAALAAEGKAPALADTLTTTYNTFKQKMGVAGGLPPPPPPPLTAEPEESKKSASPVAVAAEPAPVRAPVVAPVHAIPAEPAPAPAQAAPYHVPVHSMVAEPAPYKAPVSAAMAEPAPYRAPFSAASVQAAPFVPSFRIVESAPAQSAPVQANEGSVIQAAPGVVYAPTFGAKVVEVPQPQAETDLDVIVHEETDLDALDAPVPPAVDVSPATKKSKKSRKASKTDEDMNKPRLSRQDEHEVKESPKPEMRRKPVERRDSSKERPQTVIDMHAVKAAVPQDVKVSREAGSGTITLKVTSPVIIGDQQPPLTHQPPDVGAVEPSALTRADSEEDLLGAGGQQAPHVLALLSCKTALLQGMDAKYVTGPLINRGLLQQTAAHQVTSRKSILNRNKKMLQILKTLDENTFHAFCGVLEDEAGLPQLAEELRAAFQQYSAAAASSSSPQQQQSATEPDHQHPGYGGFSQQQPQQQQQYGEIDQYYGNNEQQYNNQGYNSQQQYGNQGYDNSNPQQQQYHINEQQQYAPPPPAAEPSSPGGSQRSDQPHQLALLTCKEALQEQMDAKNFSEPLVAAGIISRDVQLKILSRKSRLNRNKTLLQHLRGTDEATFRRFCDVLRFDAGITDLADRLEYAYQQYIGTDIDDDVPAPSQTLSRGRSKETLL